MAWVLELTFRYAKVWQRRPFSLQDAKHFWVLDLSATQVPQLQLAWSLQVFLALSGVILNPVLGPIARFFVGTRCQ
jgi:hypothetical protein